MQTSAFARPSTKIGFRDSLPHAKKENQPSTTSQSQSASRFGGGRFSGNARYVGTAFTKATPAMTDRRNATYTDEDESTGDYTTDFPLPSSPPLRYTGNPVFKRRTITPSHTRSASWDSQLLPPPPPESDFSDASDISSALPTHRRNFKRDQDLIRRITTSTEAVGVPSSSYYDDINNTTLKPNFNEDDLDANTPRLERQLVKHATRELGGSRLEAAKRSNFRGVAGSVGSGSEEGSDGTRQEWRAQRLLASLSRGAASAKPVNAADIHTDGFGKDTSTNSLVSIRRSLSDSSGDGGRRRTSAQVLGPYSPSRRRRLKEALAKKPETTPGLASRHSWNGPMPAVPEAADFSLQRDHFAKDISPEVTITTTIDWLAAAAPPAQANGQGTLSGAARIHGKVPISSSRTDRTDNQNQGSASTGRAPLTTSASTSSLRLSKPNGVTAPRASKAYTAGISAIAELSEPPTSSPFQDLPTQNYKPLHERLNGATNPDTTTHYVKPKQEEDPDETRDILRRLSRAASSSPGSSPQLQNAHLTRPHARTNLGSKGNEATIEASFLVPEKMTVKMDNDQTSAPKSSKQIEVMPDALPTGSGRFSDISSGSFAAKQTTKRARLEMTPPVKPIDTIFHQNTAPPKPSTNTSSKSTLTPYTLNTLPAEPVAMTSSPVKPEDELSSPTSMRLARIAEGSLRGTPRPIKPLPKAPAPTVVDFPDSPSLIFDPDEDYSTDDDLDRLLANDTDFSSLLRPERYEEDSFFEAATANMEPSRPSLLQRQKELAVQAKMNNRLQALHLQIRTARRGIELIERKIAMEDGDDVEAPSFVEASDKGVQTQKPVKVAEKENMMPFYRRKPRLRDWICLAFLFILFLLVFEVIAWNNSFIPAYSTMSSDEWLKLHPPGEHQWGVTMRFFVSLVMLVYTGLMHAARVVGKLFVLLKSVLSYLKDVSGYLQGLLLDISRRVMPQSLPARAVRSVMHEAEDLAEHISSLGSEKLVSSLGGEEFIPSLGGEEFSVYI